jgi:hypothetical protein
MMRSFSQFAPPCGRFSINELMGDLDLLLHFLIGSTDNDTKRAAAFGFLASKEATTLVIAALQAYAALLSSPAVGPLTAAARIQVLSSITCLLTWRFVKPAYLCLSTALVDFVDRLCCVQ